MILHAATGKAEAGLRLDDAAHRLFPQLSKTRIRKIIDWGGCSLNGSMVRVASRLLKGDETISLGVMEPEQYVEFQYRQSDLIYEDDDYLAINKVAGINSQRSPYQLKGTVEHAVGCYLKSIGAGDTVMIVHRLDRGTSGVMFFPKHRAAAAHISKMLQHGSVEKLYWAIIDNPPPSQRWEIDAPIAKVGSARYGVHCPGKGAITRFSVVKATEAGALIAAQPLTGRTHQIRVHLSHSGTPIIGDKTYGGTKNLRMMLHCRSMAFVAADGRRIEAVAEPDPLFLGELVHRQIDPAANVDAENLGR